MYRYPVPKGAEGRQRIRILVQCVRLSYNASLLPSPKEKVRSHYTSLWRWAMGHAKKYGSPAHLVARIPNEGKEWQHVAERLSSISRR